MEEILASIRRIISEEGTPPAPEPGAAPSEPREERAAVPDQADEDVLLLTEMVAEDGSVVSLSDNPENLSDEAGPSAALPEPPPEPSTEPAAENEINPPVDLAEEPAPLVSAAAAAASLQSLSELTRTVSRARDLSIGGAGRTLEDLIRELLAPMLKEWLDANLAALVERLVRQEIERLSRRASDEG
jgi:cell pole-organizing protein PopZ